VALMQNTCAVARRLLAWTKVLLERDRRWREIEIENG